MLNTDGDPGGRCGRPGEGWRAARDAATGGSAAATAAAVWAAEAGPDDRPAGHNLEDGALCFEATSYNIVPTLGTAVLQCVIAGQEVGFACGAWAVATQCRRWALVVGCTCADGAWLRQRDEEHAQQRRADGDGTECGGPECADGASGPEEPGAAGGGTWRGVELLEIDEQLIDDSEWDVAMRLEATSSISSAEGGCWV